MKKGRKGLWIALGIVVVVAALLYALVGFITDLLWFNELGYISVFLKQLFTQLKLGIPAFLIITALCYLYLMALKRGYYKKVEIAETQGVSEKTVNRIALAIGAAFGLLATFSVVTQLWFEILKFFNSTDFNILDPIFNQDVSFYIFKLEFLNQLNTILIGIIVAFIIVTVVFYLVLMSLRKPQLFESATKTEYEEEEDGTRRFTGGSGGGGGMFGSMFGGGQQQTYRAPRKQGQLDKDNIKQLLNIASRQLGVLGVIFFLMVGVNFWLRQYSLLYTGSSGVVYGAGFADINITLWVYRIVIVLAVVAAVMFLRGLQRRRLRTVLIVPIIMILLTVVGTGASMLVQQFIVSPDELSKESPYLENNIAFTRYAYDLQDVRIQTFSAANDLTAEDILNNMETISNIRINDFEPALKFYNQTQVIRMYYLFNDVDVDRYMINGEYTQTFLSSREIDETKVTDQWLSAHLLYTHGYGITLSRVDKVTDSGQPDMLIDNIPPVSAVDEIEITRPEIYYGELTNNYIITNTDEPEFDYARSDDSSVYTFYEGDAGIHLNLLNRCLFAIREGSVQILVSTNINSDSKIHIYRNIEERVRKIAPFLGYDADPYIVTVDGKLYWMLDAYTTSSYYPYSEPYSSESGVNYIRNSVKVVIDAYDGSTSFYVVDHEDPIALTLQKIYPKLFKDFSEMPESLQAHVRYPNTLFSIQANVYTKYHMTDVNTFYQNEDAWSIATEIYGQEEATMVPTYYILQLPGESQAEFINSIPYTPSGRNNLTGLLVARNDGENYGELVLYQMPRDRTIYGPRQIEAQIDQDTEIAQDFTLWSSAGSTYTRGNIFVIPIEDSLIYVEPVYLESANSSLPQVVRIILYYDDKIAYSETLAGALEEMFGEAAGALLRDSSATAEEIIESLGEGGGTETGESEGPDSSMSLQELAQEANEAYNNAVQAMQNGDWAAYGRYLEQLEEYLTQLVGGEETVAETTDDEALSAEELDALIEGGGGAGETAEGVE
ncbi:MAG: UPF0182 family protein [Bacillota bacterium]|nr:UPF0182 family protein [Bacillota bacterium]